MRVCLPIWGSQLSTVFDFASRFLLVDINGRKILAKEYIHIDRDLPPVLRVARLNQHKVDLVICGAISNPLGAMVFHSGIDVIPWVAGRVDEIIDAYIQNKLIAPRYALPGYDRGVGHRHRYRRRFRGGLY
nr:hypothetical protein [Desulfobacterales bacterium]